MQTMAATAKPGAAKQKNVLGLDFEIPEELSQLLAQEMSKQGSAADGQQQL